MAVLLSRLLSFLWCLLLIITFTSQASAQNFNYFCDHNNDRGNYTANSTYQTNLNTLLSTLTSNTEIDYGFYNSSYGKNTDKVNAIGLCRGDVKPDDCRSCLSGSRANLTKACPNRKEAIGWYKDEKCMLRYSDRTIFGTMESGPAYFMWNLNNSASEDQFNKVVENLLKNLKSKAASGDSRHKYATEKAIGPDNKTIYGLAQCTPDLSSSQCDNCLNQSITEIPNCCNNKIGARIIRPSCNLRFETSSLFFENITDSLSPSPSPLPLSPSPSPLLPPPSPSPLPPPPSPSPLPPSPSPSPSPLPPLSSPPSPVNNTSSKDMGSTSRTAVAIVPLLLLLLCSFLSVSI